MPAPVFFLQVYGERQPLLVCLAQLRRHYPRARVILRLDGDSHPMPDFDDPHLEWYREERLQTVEHGGRSCQRMMQLFLAGPGSCLIKIDSDTWVRRPFQQLPEADSLYFGGTPQRQGQHFSLQGGCLIMSRAFCQTVVDSQLLLSDSLKPPQLAWAKGFYHCLWRARVAGLSSHDWCLGWVVEQLGIPLQRHSEVLSRWRCLQLSDIWAYPQAAVVHPWTAPQWSWLGPLSPHNLLQIVRESLEIAQLLPSPSRPASEGSAWVLDTRNWCESEPPVRLIRWLCAQSLAGPLACLGASRSATELAKFFGLTSDLSRAELVLLGKSAAVPTLAQLSPHQWVLLDAPLQPGRRALFWALLRQRFYCRPFAGFRAVAFAPRR